MSTQAQLECTRLHFCLFEHSNGTDLSTLSGVVEYTDLGKYINGHITATFRPLPKYTADYYTTYKAIQSQLIPIISSGSLLYHLFKGSQASEVTEYSVDVTEPSINRHYKKL
jgi:hypothetical protein